jgi:hypothetical protein
MNTRRERTVRLDHLPDSNGTKGFSESSTTKGDQQKQLLCRRANCDKIPKIISVSHKSKQRERAGSFTRIDERAPTPLLLCPLRIREYLLD